MSVETGPSSARTPAPKRVTVSGVLGCAPPPGIVKAGSSSSCGERPSELVNRWTSYAGTGKNILGQSVLFGHGRPGPIHTVPPEFLDRYVDGLDDQAKLDLYRVLASGPPDKIQSEIAKVWERAIAEVWEMQPERRGHE